MKQDYYTLLEIERDADDRAIKSAYRKLAMQYHPDRNQGDEKTAEAKFKEISEAYNTLKDPQKRAAYDRYGHEAAASTPRQPGRPQRDPMADFVDAIFRGMGPKAAASSPPRPGRSGRVPTDDLMEAIFGDARRRRPFAQPEPIIIKSAKDITNYIVANGTRADVSFLSKVLKDKPDLFSKDSARTIVWLANARENEDLLKFCVGNEDRIKLTKSAMLGLIKEKHYPKRGFIKYAQNAVTPAVLNAYIDHNEIHSYSSSRAVEELLEKRPELLCPETEAKLKKINDHSINRVIEAIKSERALKTPEGFTAYCKKPGASLEKAFELLKNDPSLLTADNALPLIKMANVAADELCASFLTYIQIDLGRADLLGASIKTLMADNDFVPQDALMANIPADMITSEMMGRYVSEDNAKLYTGKHNAKPETITKILSGNPALYNETTSELIVYRANYKGEQAAGLWSHLMEQGHANSVRGHMDKMVDDGAIPSTTFIQHCAQAVSPTSLNRFIQNAYGQESIDAACSLLRARPELLHDGIKGIHRLNGIISSPEFVALRKEIGGGSRIGSALRRFAGLNS